MKRIYTILNSQSKGTIYIYSTNTYEVLAMLSLSDK